MGDNSVNLPPGFHFCPTDEELILNFLYPKTILVPCQADIIPDFDCYSPDPCELKGKAFSGGDKYYFFSRKQCNRETKNGFWKDQEFEEPVITSDGKKVGMKKYLVFYAGDGHIGYETNWVMQEYHLDTCDLPNTSYRRNGCIKLEFTNWVVCRVHELNSVDSWPGIYSSCDDDNGSELSYLDEVFLSLEDD